MTTPMTSMQRVLAALGGQEPDRVPLFLPVTLHGAKELGLSIREYFAKAEHVVEGQLRLRARYHQDFLYLLFYAALEAEAFGGEVLFYDDGPPNAGAPVVSHVEDLASLAPPRVEDCPGLCRVLETERLLAQRVAGEVPLVGVVMGPFSLPVMQVGFERYLDVLLERPALADHLLEVNTRFCLDWANAQLRAGATAICLFDPLLSLSMVDAGMRQRWGLPALRRCLAGIHGPVAVHGGSARMGGVLEDAAAGGAAILALSAEEDLAAVKAQAAGRLTVLGNLNALEMRRWTGVDAERAVQRLVAAAGRGGRFILGDNHGEIPWQVPDSALLALAEAVERHGRCA